jgi:hypothetical protein
LKYRDIRKPFSRLLMDQINATAPAAMRPVPIGEADYSASA